MIDKIDSINGIIIISCDVSEKDSCICVETLITHSGEKYILDIYAIPNEKKKQLIGK